jgi:L-iditol 2-dehydrogenase
MHAVHLHGPKDLRLSEVPDLDQSPAPGEALIRIGAVGICGSDLHLYQTGQIGSIGGGEAPFVPGHEFMGTVMAVGDESLDGNHQPLAVGQRVAVDPNVPCLACRMCEEGHPNLCPNHTFFGLHPRDGALRDRMTVPIRNCFPIPDSISDGGGAVLETLGVAIHAMDLAHTRVGRSAVVIGCGPVGLLVLRLAHLAGLDPLIAIDPIQSRIDLARNWGATDTITARSEDAIDEVHRLTGGLGSEIAFEAAWAGSSVDASVRMAALGGRVVLVGIPEDDGCEMPHSEARRKGLSIIFSRRMKHVTPRAIRLATGPKPKVNVDQMITHIFPLAETTKAFEMNSNYEDGVIKAVVRP